MKPFIFLLLTLSSCLGYLHGNELFRQLTINNGLAHTDANCIVQDSIGLIWIGTYSGLQSYDGYSFHTFSYYPETQKIYQSHDRINSMTCAKEKIWLGTESGLTCFDLKTHSFIPYYVDNSKVRCDFNIAIPKLHSTPSGRYLWIKTFTDMVVTQINNDTIQPLKWYGKEGDALSKKLNDLQFQGETVWGSTDKQIVRLGISKGIVTILDVYEMTQTLQKGEHIQCFFISDDFLYIRSGNGCYKMALVHGKPDKSTLTYINFHQINSEIPMYTSGEFVVDKEGSLWCAYQKGFFEIQHPFSGVPAMRQYLQDNPGDNLSALKIKDLLIDRYDNLWLGTYSWGVYCHPLSRSFCKNLSLTDFQKAGLSQSEIVSITGSEDGTLYMIVGYTNIFKYIPQTEHLSKLPIKKEYFQDIYLQDVKMSRDQIHLYIGTNCGIFIYNIHTQEMRQLRLPLPTENQLLNSNTTNIYEDSIGRLWIGTWGDGIICISQPLTEPTVILRLNTQTIPAILSDRICQLFINKDTVFLCTTNGLNRFVLDNNGKINSLSSYQTKPFAPESSLSTDYLVSMDCENDSVYWIGTIGGGLNKVILHSEKDDDYTATRYTTKNGLATNDCEIVLLDHIGNVWIGGNGITQLNIRQNEVYTYGYADGVPSNAFKSGACYKGKNGELYMGGLYGLSYFLPDYSITEQSIPYTLIFTKLFVNNEQIIPNKTYDGSILLSKALDKTSHLTLNHRQNNFAISFAALNYNLSQQIAYRYRLKGFQKGWNILHYDNNEVSFSNLPYGTYLLEVQVSVDNGMTWDTNGKVLEIELLPPWWLSGWAKLGYTMCITLIAFLAFKQYCKEKRLKKENETQKRLITQEKEKYQEKMQLFTNTSHELKTPLTLILLAAEKLDNTMQSYECKSILSNAKHMQALITELIDIKKQDLGIASINLSHLNVSEMLRLILKEVNIWTETKQLIIHCDIDKIDIKIDADKNKIGKMILNLLSNAIKYTNANGRIDVSLKLGTKKDISPYYRTKHSEGDVDFESPLCIFTVKDTGVGISPKSIQFIYERFFQVETHTQSHLGSGIGLAIVKSIVLLHKGMIIVSSERMVGTEFIIALPIRKSTESTTIAKGDVLDIKDFIKNQYCELKFETLHKKDFSDLEREQNELPTLLIVEDNEELQTTLKEQLSPFYNIYIADNGRIGLEKCMSIFPDIIISDVMMPEMDGIEMCRQIKSNLSVAYIPIVLLTAKSDIESQIEGYGTGADLYIPKPFSMKLLIVNLNRLLKQREQWFKKECFNETITTDKETSKKTVTVTTKSAENFKEHHPIIEKLKIIIAENIANPDLSSNYLAKELGVSRTKLYRDLEKGIDGQSLSDYVRNYRLDKAAHLLITTNMNVQEVMDETGFINNSHFSKVFKLRFNMLPTEYKRKY